MDLREIITLSTGDFGVSYTQLRIYASQEIEKLQNRINELQYCKNVQHVS
jgi:hypothetical protein